MHNEVLAEVRTLFASEDGPVAAARARAAAHVDLPDPEIGALLRWAAITARARTAVEIGAAGGLTGLWLIPALVERGVLTSIEADPHTHGLATTAYEEAGVEGRVRSILSDPQQVLPRLSDQGYDLMLLQGSPTTLVASLEHARRLLRPGGWLLARGVLQAGDQADAVALFLDEVARDPALTSTVLPIDGGLLLATRGDDPPASDET